MKITQDIRADAARMAGLEQKGEEFREKGSALYLPQGELAAADAKPDAA